MPPFTQDKLHRPQRAHNVSPMKASIDDLLNTVDALIVDSRRHIQVMVNKWLNAIHLEAREKQKKQYLQLLVHSCENIGDGTSLPKPFDKCPREGLLPRLPSHLLLKLKKHVYKNTGTSRSDPILFHHEASSNTKTTKSLRGGGGTRSVRGGGGGGSNNNSSSNNNSNSNNSRGVRGTTTNTSNHNVSNSNSNNNPQHSSSSPVRRGSRRPSYMPTPDTDIVPSPPNANTAAAAASAAAKVAFNLFKTHSTWTDKVTSMNRLDLENKVLELQSIVETQHDKIEYLQSELRIQEGMRKRGEERQGELHQLELKYMNKEKERELQFAAMDAIRHPAEQLLEERMQMVSRVHDATFQPDEKASDTSGPNGTGDVFECESGRLVLSGDCKSDIEFLEYLDQFTLRTERLAEQVL
jgi:hypothetical protein